MSDPSTATIDLVHHEARSGFPLVLVLVHGFTGSSLDRSDVVEPLTGARQVVTFDHCGHGESPNTGDAAHSPQEENREAWLAAVEHHLARVDKTAPAS